MLNLEKCNLSAKTCEIDVGEKEWTGTLFQGTCSLKLIKLPSTENYQNKDYFMILLQNLDVMVFY